MSRFLKDLPSIFNLGKLFPTLCALHGMSRLFTVILFVLFVQSLQAQDIVAMGTRWDDSFSEWVMYGEDEALIGEISIRWPLKGDWSEWDFRYGELSGSIQVKWKGDPNLWELRADNEVITIRTVWKDDWRQWEVKSEKHRFDVQSRYGNILEEWSLKGDRFGTLDIYTAWEGDLRDWIVDDRLDEEISLPTKIAMIFIPIFYSTPKF